MQKTTRIICPCSTGNASRTSKFTEANCQTRFCRFRNWSNNWQSVSRETSIYDVYHLSYCCLKSWELMLVGLAFRKLRYPQMLSCWFLVLAGIFDSYALRKLLWKLGVWFRFLEAELGADGFLNRFCSRESVSIFYWLIFGLELCLEIDNSSIYRLIPTALFFWFVGIWTSEAIRLIMESSLWSNSLWCNLDISADCWLSTFLKPSVLL